MSFWRRWWRWAGRYPGQVGAGVTARALLAHSGSWVGGWGGVEPAGSVAGAGRRVELAALALAGELRDVDKHQVAFGGVRACFTDDQLTYGDQLVEKVVLS